MRRQMNRDRSSSMSLEAIRFLVALILLVLLALVFIAAITIPDNALIGVLLRVMFPLVTMIVGYYFRKSHQK